MIILSDYEVARCLAAIEAVSRLGKPIAEVGDRKITAEGISGLEADLKECVSTSGEPAVYPFARLSQLGVSFGFYRYDWTLAALNSLSALPETERDWISGLLFGYSAEAIDAFARRRRV